MVRIGKLFVCDRCGKQEVANLDNLDRIADAWGEHEFIDGAIVNFCPICDQEYEYMQHAFLNSMKNHDIPQEFMETVGGVETELNTTDIRKETGFDKELDELWNLVQLEQDGVKLTNEQNSRYVELVNYLHKMNIDIPFGIEM